MLKKIFIILLLSFATLYGQIVVADPPPVNCIWLPGCADIDITNPLPPTNYDKPSWRVTTWISNLISNLIQYVAVIAVLSLMYAWLMYLLSWWEEEKLNKAKKMVIWSLVWVFLSISAWMIINMINDAKLSL